MPGGELIPFIMNILPTTLPTLFKLITNGEDVPGRAARGPLRCGETTAQRSRGVFRLLSFKIKKTIVATSFSLV